MTTITFESRSRVRRLQLALDVTSTEAALQALQPTAQDVDVIEVGTVLCLSAGMEAVRCIRAVYPAHTVLADVRIAEAGSLLAALALDAGADWVSVVSGAPLSTVAAVAKVVRERDADMQIELSDGWTWDYVRASLELGVRQFIVKRSRDAEAAGDLSWGRGDLNAIDALHSEGAVVSMTGGLTPQEISRMGAVPADIFIAGRGIYAAADPAAAVREYRSAIDDLGSVPAP